MRAGELDVRKQLAALLPAGDCVSSARDGAVIASIGEQLARIPSDATHIVVSVGGNDALQASNILDARVSSMIAAMELLAKVAEKLRREYARLLAQLASTRLPVAVCTIYDPHFPDARLRRTGTTALSVLNDAITREAFARRFALVDLRLVCVTRDEDFANAVQPSAIAGAKIARAIVDFAMQAEQPTIVYAAANSQEPSR